MNPCRPADRPASRVYGRTHRHVAPEADDDTRNPAGLSRPLQNWEIVPDTTPVVHARTPLPRFFWPGCPEKRPSGNLIDRGAGLGRAPAHGEGGRRWLGPVWWRNKLVRRNTRLFAAKQSHPPRFNLIHGEARLFAARQGCPRRDKVVCGEPGLSMAKQPCLGRSKVVRRKVDLFVATQAYVAQTSLPGDGQGNGRAGRSVEDSAGAVGVAWFIDNLGRRRPPNPRTPPSRA